jgi:transposase
MSYRIAGIDVHKKMLAVVMSDVSAEGEYIFERRKFDTTPSQLRVLAEWLVEQAVQEVVMESTAQYWKPVWSVLEQHWKPKLAQPEGSAAGKLHLAQAKSNRAPRGRKNDFADAERLVKRLVAQELVLSFVPEAEQRLWRTLTHRRQQLVGDRVRLHNQLESLLEEMHIKLSSLVSDLLGVSARRMLQAMAAGESDPSVLAALAHDSLRARRDQLCDVLSACAHLQPVYRQLLKMALEQLKLIEEQMHQLDKAIASSLGTHQDAVQRLAEVPGLGVDSAHQIVAELGPVAAVFPSAKHLSSWVGVCPGEEESAGESHSQRSPKGNRPMRRLLNQAAQAAVKAKGSIFELTFRRLKAKARISRSHLGHRSSNLPADLEDPARPSSLSRKGTCRQRQIHTTSSG